MATEVLSFACRVTGPCVVAAIAETSAVDASGRDLARSGRGLSRPLPLLAWVQPWTRLWRLAWIGKLIARDGTSKASDGRAFGRDHQDLGRDLKQVSGRAKVLGRRAVPPSF